MSRFTKYALPTPIMLDPGDQVFVIGGTNISGQYCRGDGQFGFRVATDD